MIISLFLASSSFAQDPYSVGTCEPAQAETWLEVGNVRARIYNDAPLFWRREATGYGYFVPLESTVSPMFVTNFIAAGFVEGDVRVAGGYYRTPEFSPGPIPSDDSAPSDCSAFDRFWTLDREVDFQPEDATPQPTAAMADWPVHLGAEFVNRDETPGYQPENGDYPVMNGDKQVWWIMNDRGHEHDLFESAPLGIEVHATTFGFSSDSELGNVTFYRYKVHNRGPETIQDMTIGLHNDFDLGDFNDDRHATDTTRALWFVYNADNEDEIGTNGNGYGLNPPAAGFAIIEASHSEGTLPTDLGQPPSRNLAAARMFASSGGPVGDLGSADAVYQLMTGHWKDGSLQYEGGVWGYKEWDDVNLDRPMPYWMPGDPVTDAFWSERNIDGQGTEWSLGDRRGVMASPTFDLAPGEWARFTFAFVWARGADHLDSITQLRQLTTDVHAASETILAPRNLKPPLFEDGNPPDEPEHPFWVDEPYPNPADDRLTLRTSFDKSGPASVRISDFLGRTRVEKTIHADAAGPREITLDTSGLTPGSYTVTVECWSHRATHSFVVLR